MFSHLGLVEKSTGAWPCAHGGSFTVSIRVPSVRVPHKLVHFYKRSLRVYSLWTGPDLASRQPAAPGSPRSRSGGSSAWGSWAMPSSPTKLMANFYSETQRAWSSSLQSLQTLGRQASRMLRTASWGRHLAGAAATAAELQQAVEEGTAPESAAPSLQQFQASLSRFLTTASQAEVQAACLMADLCDMAYDVGHVSPDRLRALHGLRLVATSLQQAQQQKQAVAPAAAAEAGASGASGRAGSGAAANVVALSRDQLAAIGGAVGVPLAAAGLDFMPMPTSPPAAAEAGAAAGSPPLSRQGSWQWDEKALVLSSLGYDGFGDEQVDLEPCAPWDVHQSDVQPSSPPLSPRRAMVVGAMCLDVEAEVPEAAAWRAEEDSHAQQDGSSSSSRAISPVPSDVSCAAADMAQAAAGAELAGDVNMDEAVEQQHASEARAEAEAHPAAWFVCDDDEAAGPTRIFIIQGSITLDHWRINLTIDPTDFGDQFTGFKVHRGMYEAAERLYPCMVPFVREHLAAHPDGKVVMTGHSLGGSLATVLMLLLVHRGELPPAAVGGVSTFGAPAAFCEGAAAHVDQDPQSPQLSPRSHGGAASSPCSSCTLSCNCRQSKAAAGAPAGGLLDMLGLSQDCISNVIMHRDLVPRAFVCDYTIVADVLKSWVPSFRHHSGLAACKSHKVLYNFLGNVQVLQPEAGAGFTHEDEGHCMLPPQAGLYKLTEPSCELPGGPAPVMQAPASTAVPAVAEEQLTEPSCELLSTLATAQVSAALPAVAVEQPGAEAAGQAGAAGVSSSRADGSDGACGSAGGDPMGLTLGDAILAFMNCPHPLQTLGEVRAYGPSGSISRFHNPANYTRALRALL